MTELITSEWEITSSYIYNVAIKPCYIHLDWYDFERLAKEYKPAAAVIASGDSLHDVFIQSLKEISKIAGGKIKAMILSVAHNPSSALQMAEVSQFPHYFSTKAFPSLIDENGNRKPFNRFLNDVQSIDNTYNRNYLRAEYNFVQSSALMAAKWEKIERDGDRYNLRYRTAGDGRVRPEHAALNGVTLPPSDPFWASCYPPNGWRCRCNVVRVLKDKYPETDHDDALRRADEALSSDKKGIFRFNSGQKRKTFPDYNPYTIRRCNDCDIARGKASFAFVPENDLCSACQFLHAQKNEENGASERIKKYDDAKWERTHISSNNNGFVVTQKERIAEAVNKQEIEKYEKEKRMCINLANNGHDIEFLRGNNRAQ